MRTAASRALATVDPHALIPPIAFAVPERGAMELTFSLLATRPTLARMRRLLVVDDDVAILAVVARVFRGKYAVNVAKSAVEALEQVVLAGRFDVILCDLHLPDMGGDELHANLARVAPQHARRVVFITGGATNKHDQAFLTTFGGRWLYKPFHLDDLRAVVEAASPAAIASA